MPMTVSVHAQQGAYSKTVAGGEPQGRHTIQDAPADYTADIMSEMDMKQKFIVPAKRNGPIIA